MPAHALRLIPAVTTAAAIVILSAGGALAACAPCGCFPVKACTLVAPPSLRVEQGPPDYDAAVAALEAPSGVRRYPYIRTWYGYPYWWTTQILAVGPSRVKLSPRRRCHVCDIAVVR
jgi:hypothetical protein